MAILDYYLINQMAQEHIIELNTSLGDGRATDWDQYNKIVGKIEGMKYLLSNIKQLDIPEDKDE